MLDNFMPFIVSFLHSNIGLGIAGALSVWALGHLANNTIYKSMRARWGKITYGLGALLSSLGEARLGKTLWLPIENVITDLLVFGTEQFGAGLRSDNIAKLETQLDRLSSVGSTSRAEAVASKIDSLKETQVIPQSQVNSAVDEAKRLGGLKPRE